MKAKYFTREEVTAIHNRNKANPNDYRPLRECTPPPAFKSYEDGHTHAHLVYGDFTPEGRAILDSWCFCTTNHND